MQVEKVSVSYNNKTYDCAKFTIDSPCSWQLGEVLDKNSDYMWRFIIKSSAASSVIITIGDVSHEFATSTSFKEYIQLYKDVDVTSPYIDIEFPIGTFYIFHTQLEHGDKETDWKRCQADFALLKHTHTTAEISNFSSAVQAIADDKYLTKIDPTGTGKISIGSGCTATGNNSASFGVNTSAFGNCSHVEGDRTYTDVTNGYAAHAEGIMTTASGIFSHVEGEATQTTGNASHAEGRNSKALANYTHAEGFTTNASGDAAHAEGHNTTASGNYSHAEGGFCKAISHYAHAEGYGTTAEYAAHAEGEQTNASGYYSHAEGTSAVASSTAAHAEGYKTIAAGEAAHAEGYNTTASRDYSHSAGYFTIANQLFQTVIGKYNSTVSDALFIIGNGTASTARNSAMYVTTAGNTYATKFISTASGTTGQYTNLGVHVKDSDYHGIYTTTGTTFLYNNLENAYKSQYNVNQWQLDYYDNEGSWNHGLYADTEGIYYTDINSNDYEFLNQNNTVLGEYIFTSSVDVGGVLYEEVNLGSRNRFGNNIPYAIATLKPASLIALDIIVGAQCTTDNDNTYKITLMAKNIGTAAIAANTIEVTYMAVCKYID